jgi:hypothetical protein
MRWLVLSVAILGASAFTTGGPQRAFVKVRARFLGQPAKRDCCRAERSMS